MEEKETVGMWELPVEIWEDILSRLSAEDLKTCSQVCTRWLALTDADRLWKPLCQRRRWNKIHLPLSAFSHTEERCRWRKVYESNVELYSRWRERSWTRYSLTDTVSEEQRQQQGRPFSLSSDSRTLAVGYQTGAVTIWNIWQKPSIICTIKCLLAKYPVLEVKMSATWLAALQDRLLQVYNVLTDDYFVYKIICLELGPSYNDLTATWRSLGPYFASWYRECLRVVEVKPLTRLLMVQSNSLLVVCHGDKETLYALDLGENEQTKEFTVEAKVKELLCWGTTVYIVGWENRSTKVFEYVRKERCTDLIVKSPSPCKVVLSEKFVVTVPTECGFTLQKLRVWSRKDGVCVGSRVVSSSLLHACVTDSNVVIYSEDDQIYFWNPVNDSLLRRINVGLPVHFVEARFSDFLVVLCATTVLYVYDWQAGNHLYSISAQLEWSEDCINLVWTCPTAIVNMQNGPLLPDELTPDLTSDEPIKEPESLSEPDESIETIVDSVNTNEDESKGNEHITLVEAEPNSSLELSKELEKILTDLEKNSFRECVSEVLGRDVEMVDSFSDKGLLTIETIESEMFREEESAKPIQQDREPNDAFLYDTSSSEESLAGPITALPSRRSSPLAQIVDKLAPWREIFPPLYIYHRFPQRTLFWLSTALKNRIHAIPIN